VAGLWVYPPGDGGSSRDGQLVQKRWRSLDDGDVPPGRGQPVRRRQAGDAGSRDDDPCSVPDVGVGRPVGRVLSCLRRGDHPSATTVAGRLVRSTRMLGRAALGRILSDLAPGGVCLAAPVARRTGGLLHHRFTLTRTRRCWRSVLCGTDPAGFPGWLLATTLPCGARTFLDPVPKHRAAAARPTHSARSLGAGEPSVRLGRGVVEGVGIDGAVDGLGVRKVVDHESQDRGDACRHAAHRGTARHRPARVPRARRCSTTQVPRCRGGRGWAGSACSSREVVSPSLNSTKLSLASPYQLLSEALRVDRSVSTEPPSRSPIPPSVTAAAASASGSGVSSD
jgi:hypothetical protein